jgi:hypothetical protein
MNTKRNFLTAAATTAIVGLASIAPAQAASFGTSGISFDKDTTVDFEFTQSYGRYRTDLRLYEVKDGAIFEDFGTLFKEVKAADEMVFNAAKNRWEPTSEPLGTAGNAVVDYQASFNFEAGKEYALGIVNYGFWEAENDPTPYGGIFYSTSALNTGGTQQAVFGSSGGEELFQFDDASLFQEGNPLGGWVDISFDDAGNKNDKDFQDFSLKAKAVSTPEPTVLFGLAVAAGGMFMTRRNKNKAS